MLHSPPWPRGAFAGALGTRENGSEKRQNVVGNRLWWHRRPSLPRDRRGEKAARGGEVMLLISEKKVDPGSAAKYPHLRFETMPAVAKPPTFSPRMLPFLWKLWGSIGRCKADYLGVPGGRGARHGRLHLAAAVLCRAQAAGCKTFIHDSNARPGRANVMTSRFCTRVFLGLEPAKAFFPDNAKPSPPARRCGRKSRICHPARRPRRSLRARSRDDRPSWSPAAARARGG